MEIERRRETGAGRAAPDDDLRSAAALADPHGFYRRLRERAPVHWSEPSRGWILTGYAEVLAALRDDAHLSADRLGAVEARLAPAERAALEPAFDLLRGWMVFRDPPEHERLRDPVRRAFTPRAMSRLESRVSEIVEELLDGMRRKRRCDLVADFAFPLPAIVIAELLGVPAEDRERFKTWSSKLGGIVFGAVESPGRNAAVREGALHFASYFGELVRRYEREPADNLIGALLASRDAPGGLPPERILGACTMLLFAGHETTTGLIASGVAHLLRHPDQLERLRGDPSLAAPAVEELLRFDGPARVMVRLARDDHERGGARVRAGERLYLCLAGANRDPAVFADPDRLDVGRHPNPHLAFGHGLHFCLGANLARAEARAAIPRLLERFPDLALEVAEPPRAATIVGGGVRSLPVRLV